MRKNNSIRKAIIIIIVISLFIAIAGSILVNIIQKATHPRDYSEYITEYSNEYGVPEAIIYAVIKTESNFDASSESKVGAIGLMQLLPSTFEDLTDNYLKENLSKHSIYDPEINIKYGTYYLSYLYEYFDCKSWDIVFAAYNAGMGNVTKWLEDPEYTDEDGNLTNIPFEETRNYVKKVQDAILDYEKLYYDK